ncbi:hypothetical protein N4G41_04620 [Kosakonia sacchari]|uniref:hypothetical protein n=1 Tax=Kosakonia sacchari TaxID=1158459 RepID=UPI002ACE3779|nr:hypothetical protein [Kosakonia sacchari]MDZ7320913.1 hypothetical protein [Kosakonia sacchari]
MMRKFLILLILVLLSQRAVSSIIPEIQVPSDFNKDRFDEYYNNISSNSGNGSCDNISFKNFYPPEYISSKIKYPPFNTWFCLFAVDVTHDGYGPGRALAEKVYFDQKTELWKKTKYTVSRESTQRSREVYGIKSLSELQPLELYNIQSVNTSGYAVIDNNIPLQEKQKGVKKSLSFCLIRGDAAFCGSGSMVNLVDGKEIDFTPYMLKSLETVEMGLREKSNHRR